MRRRLAGLPGLLALSVLAAGCLPAPATTQARAVSELWMVFMVAAAAVAVLVWGLITYSIIRYRRGSRDRDSIPTQTHDSLRLEVAWTVGPIILAALLFWLSLGALDRINAHEPSDVTVEISAYRWQWRFDYPGTGVSVNGTPDVPAEMVVPVGEPIHLVLTSPDVIHSFYVPAFLFKRDAIPGHPTEFDLTIEEPGAYGGQCAEFCGVFHDRMTMTVRAVTRPEYEAWLTANAAAPAATP